MSGAARGDGARRARDLGVAALAGALFGLGLVVSGMTSPARILAFLDVGGRWDPSLALVMGGALAVHAPIVRLARRRPAPLLGGRFHWPSARRVEPSLVAGAALFGAGWGLAGYCPGPALVSAVGGGGGALAFVAAMLAGTAAGRALAARRRGGAAAPDAVGVPTAAG